MLQEFIHRHQLYQALPDGCDLGVTDENGVPHLKKWRVVTTSRRLAKDLDARKCQHGKDFRHSSIEGGKTVKTGFYPIAMCQVIATSLFPDIVHASVPAMPVISSFKQEEHREK